MTHSVGILSSRPQISYQYIRLWCFAYLPIREAVKYYLADFLSQGGTGPPLLNQPHSFKNVALSQSSHTYFFPPQAAKIIYLVHVQLTVLILRQPCWFNSCNAVIFLDASRLTWVLRRDETPYFQEKLVSL